MDETNLKKLEGLLKVIDEGVTKEEFIKAFEGVIELVLKIEKRNSEAVEKLEKTYALLIDKMKNDHTSTLADLKSKVNDVFVGDQLKRIKDEHDKRMSLVDERVKSIKDGRDSVIPGPPGPSGKSGRDGSPDTPKEIVKKLESLSGEDRLDRSAVKGLDEELKKVGNQISFVGGGRGIALYVGGTKKGLIKTVNLIAGSGISLTYDQASGRNDITISASAVALTKLVATGTVDGANTTFTFVSKPTIIISDGASYQENKGWTWSGLTATLTIPPQFDIYGL